MSNIKEEIKRIKLELDEFIEQPYDKYNKRKFWLLGFVRLVVHKNVDDVIFWVHWNANNNFALAVGVEKKVSIFNKFKRKVLKNDKGISAQD